MSHRCSRIQTFGNTGVKRESCREEKQTPPQSHTPLAMNWAQHTTASIRHGKHTHTNTYTHVTEFKGEIPLTEAPNTVQHKFTSRREDRCVFKSSPFLWGSGRSIQALSLSQHTLGQTVPYFNRTETLLGETPWSPLFFLHLPLPLLTSLFYDILAVRKRQKSAARSPGK